MIESRESEHGVAVSQAQSTRKKPYQKPAVRHERVFETTALTCGKTQPTQGQCVHNRKNS
jgi:hypothetical protein